MYDWTGNSKSIYATLGGISLGKITKKDRVILDSIKKYMLDNGKTPTIRDIMEVTGLKSTNSVYIHFQHLVDLGYIIKDGYGNGYAVKGMMYVEKR